MEKVSQASSPMFRSQFQCHAPELKGTKGESPRFTQEVGARSPSELKANDIKYSLSSKDVLALGGSEISRLPELFEVPWGAWSWLARLPFWNKVAFFFF